MKLILKKSCVFKTLFFPILLLFVFGLNTSIVYAQTKFKVALDAGHGDHDYGAIYNGHIEKKITLAITLKVGKILEKESGVDVIYTRKSDQFIDLVERANIANRADANIFVSIHCNANKNTEAFGCETYVMGMSKNASNLEAAKKENEVITLEKDYKEKYQGFDPKSPETMIGLTMMQEEYLDNSITLAGKIQSFFMDMGKKSRGVKQAPFMVLHKAYMPRVLIETGFISNPKEGNELDSEEGQQKIAEAIAGAIMGYKKEYYGKGESSTDIKPSQKVEKDHPVDKKDSIVTKVNKNTPKAEPKNEILPNGAVVFKVQIAASGTKIEPVPSNFKGLSDISIESLGTLYKYMYGQTTSYNEAKSLLSEAKAKGYSTAYIVAFRDGVKITVQEALKP